MLLDGEQLDAVWEEYASSGSESAMESLVRRYQPLAAFLARRALMKAPAYQDPQDILSYAHHGLLDAIRRYEPGRVKFETYATRRIAGAIVDGQRKQDPLTRSTRKRVKTLTAAVNQLWDELDRDPTLDELAGRLGESVGVVRETQLSQKSLVGSLDADNGVLESWGVTGEAEVESQLAELRQRVANRVRTLPDQTRAFVLAYYGLDQSMRDVGITLGLSGEWCKRARSQVTNSLR